MDLDILSVCIDAYLRCTRLATQVTRVLVAVLWLYHVFNWARLSSSALKSLGFKVLGCILAARSPFRSVCCHFLKVF